MIQYKGMNHVALATRDMDKTIRFWRDLLGMRLVAGHGKPGHRQYFFQISESSYISFFEWPEVEPMPDKDAGRPAKGPYVFDHVCFTVASEEALWELKDRLEVAGIWVTEVLDNGFIHSIFSTDPNNIQLEFCYEIKGVDLAKTPRMVDLEPSETTLEGSEPQPGKWPPVTNPTPEEKRRVYSGELRRIITGENKWRTKA